MTNTWQKVRVTFTDAEGKEASAVMWTLGGDFVQNHPEGSPSDNPGYAYIEYGADVKVEPIRELPTGLGAVVETHYTPDTTDKYVLLSGGWVHSEAGYDVPDEVMAQKNFTVLSEGIEL